MAAKKVDREKMASEKVDRRVQRTRQIVMQAFRELILEKPYDAITVQDIVDQANIGRATFYTHYHDKDDLLHSMFQIFVGRLMQKMTTAVEAGAAHGEDQLIPALALFRQVSQNYEHHKAMANGRGTELVDSMLHKFFSEQLQKQLNHLLVHKPKPEVPLAVVVNYLVSALLSLLRWWVEQDMPYSPERMDEMFQQLAKPTIESVLGIESYCLDRAG